MDDISFLSPDEALQTAIRVRAFRDGWNAGYEAAEASIVRGQVALRSQRTDHAPQVGGDGSSPFGIKGFCVGLGHVAGIFQCARRLLRGRADVGHDQEFESLDPVLHGNSHSIAPSIHWDIAPIAEAMRTARAVRAHRLSETSK